MPRDVNGNYTLPAGNPVVTNTIISSVWANTTLTDLATAMTNSLDRTGASAGMTGQLKLAAGTVGAPALTWTLEPSSGLYRNAAGDFRFSVAGTDITRITTTQYMMPDGAVAGPGMAFISEPGTGWYRVGAGDVAFAILGTRILEMNPAAGNQIVFFNSAIATTAVLLAQNTSTVDTQNCRIQVASGSTNIFVLAANQNTVTAPITAGVTGPAVYVYTGQSVPLVFGTNNIARGQVDGSGRWVFNAPSATGQSAYTFNGINAQNVMVVQAGAGAGGAFGLQINAGTNTTDRALTVQDQSGATSYFRILGNGECYTLLAPAATGVGGMAQVGYVDTPQNIQNATYGLLITDRGKHIYHTSGSAHTFTIPANASVAYPIGTTITIVNEVAAGIVTLAITTDTLVWYPSGTTGSRSLAAGSVATILKVTATKWVLNGVGIS